jgi:hypothetical protein
MENATNIKKYNLDVLADYQAKLCREPELRTLFFELTLKCNERCLEIFGADIFISYSLN